MKISDQNFSKIDKTLNNLSNYKNNLMENLTHNLIESILYYKLFIDNYIEINNYIDKYSNVIYSMFNSNITEPEKINYLKEILNKILDKVSKKEQTGGMNLTTFKNEINKYNEDIIRDTKLIDTNQKFINDKITSLVDRFEKMIKNESLYSIRNKIELIINELEKKTGQNKKLSETDYTTLLAELKEQIEKLRNKGENDKAILNSIKGLEEYAGYIEKAILSSNQTLNTVSKGLKGGSQFINIQNGSSDSVVNFMETEKKEYQVKIDKIINTKFNFFTADFNVLTDISQNIIYRQAIDIQSLCLSVDILITNYNKFIDQLIQINPFLLGEGEIEKRWNAYFENKNSTYYQDFKEQEIYFYSNVKNALSKLKKIEFKVNITLSNNNNDSIIQKLDDTNKFFTYINKILILIIESFNMYRNGNYNNKIIDEIHQSNIFQEKSFILEKFSKYEQNYEQKGGATKTSSLPLPMEEYNIFNLYLDAFLKKITSNDNFNSDNLKTELNQIIIKKTQDSTENVQELFSKISNKLGEPNNSNNSQINSNISTFEGLLNNTKTLSGGSVESSIKRPRLDPFKKALKECLEKLKPVINNISTLKNLLDKFSSGKLDHKETISLLKLYDLVDEQTKLGINSYIQVIPMIFFTIEFPPSIYAKEACKYGLSYSPETEKYTYKLISDKSLCTNPDTTTVSAYTHGAFFEADNKNGTMKLVNDPIIGLTKLINAGSSSSGPNNKVINMMFALGASGTGKTTRYFGNKVAPNPDDHTGIVTSIIQKAISKPETTVELAYFVSYGRYEGNKLNEFLLFFDINKEDVFSYYMPTQAENTNLYSDFYTKLVSKKLRRIDYSTIKSYIEEGSSIPNLTDLDQGSTFREILEQPTNEKAPIWSKIDANTKLDDIFENLLSRQKKMHTVLPTKNNIESSRGHTCILIKIKDSNGKTKYFPLFDMAGTENTTTMNEFLTKNRKQDKMAHIVSLFSKYSQTNKLMNGSIGQINSLEDLVGENGIEKFKNYVTKGTFQGGSKFDVSTVEENTLDEDQGKNTLLTKMVNEGYYINHTIGMLIFAAMCVGQSMNSTVTSDGKDNFDNIENDIFEELEKFTSLIKNQNSNKTKLLLTDFKFSSILSTTSIWSQILFSFLYWNEETENSASDNFNNKNKEYQNEIIKSNLNPIVYGNIKLSDMLNSENIAIEDIVSDLEKGKYYLQMNDNGTVSKVLSADDDSDNLKRQKIELESNITQIEKQISESLDDTTRLKLNDYKKKISEIQSLEGKLETIKPILLNIGFPKDIPKADQYDTGNIKLVVDNTPWQSYIGPKIVKTIDSSSASKIKGAIKKAKYVYVGINMSKADLQTEVDKITSGLETYQDQLKIFQDKLSKVNTKLEEFSKLYTKENVGRFLKQLKINKVKQNGDNLFINNSNDINLKTILDLCKYVKNIKKTDLPIGLIEKNQMKRIKDAKISATKMVLMHLVTGQAIKHNMVLETIGLTTSLWNATQINLTNLFNKFI